MAKSSIMLGSICSQLLAMHALTGSDSTSYPHKKGKSIGLNVLNKYREIGLEIFGDPTADKDLLVETSKKFFCNLYGSLNPIPMKELRYKLFSTSKSTLDVKTLLPTDGPLLQHLLQSHYHVFIWKSALTATPTHLNSTDWGWELIDGLIEPVLGVYGVAHADVLKVVACIC